jgi:hypothetical protein
MSYRTANLQTLHFIYLVKNTEYFKHAAHSPFFFSSKCSLFHNAIFFGSCLIHILHTGCAKIKKKSGAKGLISFFLHLTLPPPPPPPPPHSAEVEHARSFILRALLLHGFVFIIYPEL